MTDRNDDKPASNHPVTDAAIQCLVPTDDGRATIPDEQVDKLRFVLHEVKDAGQLAVIAEELLLVAVTLDEKRRSPDTADVFAALAKEAATLSLDLRKAITGEMHRIADVGARYKKFIDQRAKFRERQEPPSGETLRVEALDPKRRV